MGTNLLHEERVAAGCRRGAACSRIVKTSRSPYIKVVVRKGKLAMPRLTRVEVTDAELDAIARYLAKGHE